MPALLGIDIGTSGCRAMAFTPEGVILAESDARHPLHTPRRGWAEQDPSDWWSGVVASIRGVLGSVDPEDIEAIGIDGQSWACVAVDGGLSPLCPTPIWMDTRAAREADEMTLAGGRDVLLRQAGNLPVPGHSGPKALWLLRHHPEAMACAAALLQSNGYIVARLTGVLTQDRAQGYGWACYDMRKQVWDLDFGRSMGLPVHLLPPLYPCHAVVGGVTRDAARITGLLEGTPVVAGGLDAACGTLGAGVIAPGQTQEQGGNAGGFSACLDRPVAHEKLILAAHVVPGRYLLQGGTVGGAVASSWGRRLLGHPDYAVLDAEAESVPPGARGVSFLPYLSGERSPLWDPEACGVFYGLSLGARQPEVWRALLEGVAFALRHNLETAEDAGVRIGTLRSVGGGAFSRVWTQIKADATGKVIEVAQPRASTALGAAMLAGVGAGVFASFEEAAARMTRLQRVHPPDPRHAAAYDTAYRRYRALYEALSPIMHDAALAQE